jgi:hypothetical protein
MFVVRQISLEKKIFDGPYVRKCSHGKENIVSFIALAVNKWEQLSS